jgi:hypothetical protein
MSRIIDHTGQRFGRLLVLRRAPPKRPRGLAVWICRCDCGMTRTVRGPELRSGKTKSCGCYMRDVASLCHFKHGHAPRSGRSAEYLSWKAMLARCTNKKASHWNRYGGRGIRICRRWASSFKSFYSDMGSKPSPRHSIDRKKNDLHYSCGKCSDCKRNGWKSNCRWATPSEQLNNTSRTVRISFNGKTDSIANWARRVRIGYKTLLARLRQYGWSTEDAITRPVRSWPQRVPLRPAS